MQLVVSPAASSFLHAQGDRLYVWPTRNRCCGGGLFLETAVEPPPAATSVRSRTRPASACFSPQLSPSSPTSSTSTSNAGRDASGPTGTAASTSSSTTRPAPQRQVATKRRNGLPVTLRVAAADLHATSPAPVSALGLGFVSNPLRWDATVTLLIVLAVLGVSVEGGSRLALPQWCSGFSLDGPLGDPQVTWRFRGSSGSRSSAGQRPRDERGKSTQGLHEGREAVPYRVGSDVRPVGRPRAPPAHRRRRSARGPDGNGVSG